MRREGFSRAPLGLERPAKGRGIACLRDKASHARPPRRGAGQSRARPPLWRDPHLWVYTLLTLLALISLATRDGGARPVAEEACRVSYVFDGDTVEVICGGKKARVRLAEVDTPELFSPACEAERLAAKRAKIALETWVKSAQNVMISRHGHDRYGRDIASLYLDGANAGERLVAEGLGRSYHGEARRSWCEE